MPYALSSWLFSPLLPAWFLVWDGHVLLSTKERQSGKMKQNLVTGRTSPSQDVAFVLCPVLSCDLVRARPPAARELFLSPLALLPASGPVRPPPCVVSVSHRGAVACARHAHLLPLNLWHAAYRRTIITTPVDRIGN